MSAAKWTRYTHRLATYTPLPDVAYHDVDDRWAFWAWNKRAVVLERPDWPPLATLGAWREKWYAARRDANLLGRCPICGAGSLVTDMTTLDMQGTMEHAADCPVADGNAKRLKGTVPR